MTSEEHKQLYELVQNPLPGSKMEAAKEYGIDLTLNLRRLLLTPTERAREMESALRFVEKFRGAAVRIKS
jgi:RNase P/RNase MRP subunit p30